MDFKTIDGIKKAGFSGFRKIGDLFTDFSAIPDIMGVYLVLNPSMKVNFLTEGTGGHFKGKNPNVSVEELKQNWVDNSIVVYIGKAGSDKVSATLRSRLRQYLRFGQGKNAGHRGGRYIWQLSNSHDLIICWKPLLKDDPRGEETGLIQEFSEKFGKKPFANLVG
ncbi:MAG: hypothetical protein CVU05_06295 [Bacteroidetes bacterium HGW-Bacteroidetes-21]|jgi:hypothetical protein|nr:MAG: hypothetical protein CVU05_06295 [Bacteroidetes bacterium HGW-Bacteroidetes-21]